MGGALEPRGLLIIESYATPNTPRPCRGDSFLKKRRPDSQAARVASGNVSPKKFWDGVDSVALLDASEILYPFGANVGCCAAQDDHRRVRVLARDLDGPLAPPPREKHDYEVARPVPLPHSADCIRRRVLNIPDVKYDAPLGRVDGLRGTV